MNQISKQLNKIAQEMDIKDLKDELDSADDAIEELGDVLNLISEAGFKMESIERTVKTIKGLEYNMSGNMRSYVTNYLKDSRDSIEAKLEKYVEELEEYQEELQDMIKEAR